MFKLIVAGSREFSDYAFLKQKLKHLLQNVNEEIEIVSGTANGADKLGERFANEHGYKIARFPADWNQFGLRAGHLRNEDMAKYGNACVVFWVNKSKGTKSMIDFAKKYNLKLRIYES
jgi:hypothetical protein